MMAQCDREDVFTSSNLVEDTDEHSIALPVYFREIYVLEIAFLPLLAFVGAKREFTGCDYLPSMLCFEMPIYRRL
jgi:hypothetical protein